MTNLEDFIEEKRRSDKRMREIILKNEALKNDVSNVYNSIMDVMNDLDPSLVREYPEGTSGYEDELGHWHEGSTLFNVYETPFIPYKTDTKLAITKTNLIAGDGRSNFKLLIKIDNSPSALVYATIFSTYELTDTKGLVSQDRAQEVLSVFSYTVEALKAVYAIGK